MKKKNILLKVSPAKITGFVADEPKFEVTAWDIRHDHMIDEHVTEEFEELYDLGLDEESEGYMVYYGELSMDELMYKLNDLGFSTIRTK